MTQWFHGRALDSGVREIGFESPGIVLSNWASFSTPHCYISLSYMNEYLAIDRGGYLYEQPSHINCNVAGDFPEKLKWCLIAQFCQGSKALRSPEDWILRYIRTYLF